MSSPQPYMPQRPSALDTVQYVRRVADQILRNNPLHNGAVESGLVKWFGNYEDIDGSGKIVHVFIGEFHPVDTNLPGDPPQKGFALFRDDSGQNEDGFAFALYDPQPSFGDGLRQVLRFQSRDGAELWSEHRSGGIQFPRSDVMMNGRDSDLALWPGTDSASFSTIFEGRVSVIGHQLHYRMWCACTGGSNGQFRIRVESGGPEPDVTGTTHALGINANGVFDDTVDISDFRGRTVTVYWEARRVSGTGKSRAVVISMQNYT
jgi:hypothetical protein